MIRGTGDEGSGGKAGPLELDLESQRPLGPRFVAGALSFLRGLGRRAPLWIPFLLLVQVLCNGWLPTRAESRRLDRAEAEVKARAEALEEDSRSIEEEARMLDDDIYRERVRKSLLDPSAEPLRLESARRP